MNASEWMTLILTLTGGAAALRAPFTALRDKRHLRCVDARISCPRSGADVDCSLLRDGRTGEYAKVESCSASNPGGKPTCDQDCVWILNRGIPLLPKTPESEEAEASSLVNEVAQTD
jgi:hypothetical protein